MLCLEYASVLISYTDLLSGAALPPLLPSFPSTAQGRDLEPSKGGKGSDSFRQVSWEAERLPDLRGSQTCTGSPCCLSDVPTRAQISLAFFSLAFQYVTVQNSYEALVKCALDTTCCCCLPYLLQGHDSSWTTECTAERP